MQSTLTPPSRSAHPAAGQVWDLGSTTQHRFTPRARPSHRGPIAASFGAAALCAAVLPGASAEARLLLAIVLGAIAAITGFSALRRRQTRTAMLLAVAGLVAPVIAISSVAMAIGGAAPTVTSATVQRSTLQPMSAGMIPTQHFVGLAAQEQESMKALLAATLLQLQTMHGSWAPLPESLAISNGVLVEGDGMFRGTTLGTVPSDEQLAYQIADDGTAFRIAVTSASDPRATIWADRALPVG